MNGTNDASGANSARSNTLHIALDRHDDGVTTMALRGDLDCDTADDFLARAQTPLADAQLLEIDLSRLDFLHSSGLRALLRLRKSAVSHGVPLRLRAEHGCRARGILDLVGFPIKPID